MAMIVCSATWCNPCQYLKKNVFPTQEAGDYFNDKFVMKHYELDKSDPDQLSSKYNIVAYPTSLILDETGRELARVLGAAADAENFIQMIEKAILPKNQLEARKKRFMENTTEGICYIRFLRDTCYKNKEANDALTDLFKRRTIEENFNAESMEFYKHGIDYINSIVITYMLEHPQEVKEVVGEKEYNDLLALKVNNYISQRAFSPRFNVDAFRKAIEYAMSQKEMRTTFVLFMDKVQDAYIDKNYPLVFKSASKYIKCSDTKNRLDITTAIRMLCGRDVAVDNMRQLIEMYSVCIDCEHDNNQKEMYRMLKKDMESMLNMKKRWKIYFGAYW